MSDAPIYRRILNATEGSPTSERASAHALYLAKQLGAELEVLAVVDLDYRLGIHLGEEVLEMQEQGHHAIDEVERMAKAQGVSVTKLLVRGDAGPAIVNVATKRGCDLIVIGAHQMGTLERVLLGSTSQYVAQQASIPVLIVREGGR